MRPGQIAELQAFLTVAQERSFRRAAARLNLTPSTLSHSVRGLEERLGVMLLNRTTRAVAPTQAGAALLAELAPAFQAMDAAVETVNGFRARPQGVIRLTVPRSGATQVMASCFAAFARACPDVTLEMTVEERFVDIIREGYDAGIRLGESVEQDMVTVRVSPDLYTAVVGAPAYFADHAPPRVPQDLKMHRCINRRLSGSGGLYRWEFAKHDKRFSVLVDGPLILNADDMMLAAALEGVGLACINLSDALPGIRAGRLVRVLEDWCPSIPGFFLYYPGSRQGSASLHALVEVLTSAAA